MFSVAVFALAKLFACNSKRERYARLWVQPPMSSLSDRNMRLGDVLLPPGIKQRLRRVLLMQSSVALSLHFGWDSQLNTSEMSG